MVLVYLFVACNLAVSPYIVVSRHFGVERGATFVCVYNDFVTFAVLRPIMRLYFKLRYGYTAKRSGLPKGAYLIISNHQTTMDPFMLSVSFKFPVYFIASDDLFNLKSFTADRVPRCANPQKQIFARYCGGKNIFRVIKEGGAVGVLSRGQPHYFGRTVGNDRRDSKACKIA